jgi:NAD(P)-dependent dehydrogenase (short-subunit alcohol dehydrogenase family)
MKDFRDHVAVITGAASGIGRAIAKRCAVEGMKVVLAGINLANLTQVEAELKANGATAMSVQTDVASRHEVEALAQATLDTFGGVHLLVNNVGVGAGLSVWDSSWNDWEWVINVNLWGVIHGVKVFTPIMLGQDEPCHIVNTSSIAGLIAYHPSAPYQVTKHAVVALSEQLYLSLKQRHAHVGVSVLCPGFVKTEIMNGERNRPPHLRNEPAQVTPGSEATLEWLRASVEAGMSPEQVADQVFSAIIDERFYILTHPDSTTLIQDRMENLLHGRDPRIAS